jgi:hypothetical protein
MTEDQFNDWKKRLRAMAARESTPAARAMRKLAAEGRAARSAPQETRTLRESTEREQLLDHGFIFSVRDQDRATSAAEHRARRRRAEQETGQRDRVWQALRDAQGMDAADAWLRDAG